MATHPNVFMSLIGIGFLLLVIAMVVRLVANPKTRPWCVPMLVAMCIPFVVIFSLRHVRQADLATPAEVTYGYRQPPSTGSQTDTAQTNPAQYTADARVAVAYEQRPVAMLQAPWIVVLVGLLILGAGVFTFVRHPASRPYIGGAAAVALMLALVAVPTSLQTQHPPTPSMQYGGPRVDATAQSHSSMPSPATSEDHASHGDRASHGDGASHGNRASHGDDASRVATIDTDSAGAHSDLPKNVGDLATTDRIATTPAPASSSADHVTLDKAPWLTSKHAVRPTPAWVGVASQVDGDLYTVAVASDPFTTEAECELQLNQRMLVAVQAYVIRNFSDADDILSQLNTRWIRDRLIIERHVEPTQASVGPMVVVNVLLRIDAQTRSTLNAMARQAVIDRRVGYTAISAALVLGLLGAAYGWLRVRNPGGQEPGVSESAEFGVGSAK